ncbi:MAG: LD-carboxypeptidase [Candidatus Gracilibacteria bacterium]|nr:LD-carboxypeptidase [Candidatus Gracilibacteria bacterium]
MKKIFPQKLQKGDEIRVVSPSLSFSIISKENQERASEKIKELGYKLSFGENINEIDEFQSSSVESRIQDLHQAFSDQNVKMVLTTVGGDNSNQLLKYIDWNLIKNNPKIFCGFSDITVLNNAIYAKTGLINYSGLCYVDFSGGNCFDYSLEYFEKCLIKNENFEVLPSKEWSDNVWYIPAKDQKIVNNTGFWIINEGEAKGTILGGNINSFALLKGTEYFPDLTDSIIFIEDCNEASIPTFDRDLQSLVLLPDFPKVKGILVCRFQNGSKATQERLVKIIKNKKELDGIPVIANVDFGHTAPIITFPIGGTTEIKAIDGEAEIRIIEH